MQEDSEEDKPHKKATQSIKQPERESGNQDDQPAPEDDIIDVPSVVRPILNKQSVCDCHKVHRLAMNF